MWLTKYLLVGILVSGIIIGLCGVSFSQETVSFAHWTLGEEAFDEFWDAVQPDFEKEYPNIKVVRAEIPRARYWDQITVLAIAGPAPDVVGVTPPYVKQWIAMEAVESLEEWMDLTEIKRTFAEQQRTFCMEKGKTYAVVQGARSLILIYNEKLFEEAGIKNPPSSPEELVATSMKLTQPEKGQYGIELRTNVKNYGNVYDRLLVFPVGYGGNYAKDGVPTATDPNTIRGIKLYKLLYDLKLGPAVVSKVAREMLFKEKLAMHIDGPWEFTQAKASAPETYPHLMAAMTPFPNKATIGGAHHFLVMPTLAKNKSAGGKFIQFCMRDKYQRLYSKWSGVMPGNLENTSEELLTERWYRPFVEAMNYAVLGLPPGFAPVAREFTRIVVEHVCGEIALKGKPVEETMEKCQRKLMKLKEEM